MRAEKDHNQGEGIFISRPITPRRFARQILFPFACALLLGLIAALILTSSPVPSRPLETGLAAIHVPRGFKVEKVDGGETRLQWS